MDTTGSSISVSHHSNSLRRSRGVCLMSLTGSLGASMYVFSAMFFSAVYAHQSPTRTAHSEAYTGAAWVGGPRRGAPCPHRPCRSSCDRRSLPPPLRSSVPSAGHGRCVASSRTLLLLLLLRRGLLGHRTRDSRGAHNNAESPLRFFSGVDRAPQHSAATQHGRRKLEDCALARREAAEAGCTSLPYHRDD